MTKSRLPQPRGWRILIERVKPKEKTASGIFLPDQAKEAESYLSITAKVVALGSACYTNRDTGEPWASGPWCKPGDWIVVPKFTQFKMDIDGNEYRIINDDEVIAVIDDPLAIKVYT